MATAPSIPPLSVNEYLASGYSPDCEYVDGVLVERNVGTLPHSLLQQILVRYFQQFEESLGFATVPECRTRTHSSRFRIPDVMLIRTPFDRRARFYDGVPLAIIEILSPEDRLRSVIERFEEYQALAVPHIVQMDPERRLTHVFESDNLIRKELISLGDNLPFDTAALYGQLD